MSFEACQTVITMQHLQVRSSPPSWFGNILWSLRESKQVPKSSQCLIGHRILRSVAGSKAADDVLPLPVWQRPALLQPESRKAGLPVLPHSLYLFKGKAFELLPISGLARSQVVPRTSFSSFWWRNEWTAYCCHIISADIVTPKSMGNRLGFPDCHGKR